MKMYHGDSVKRNDKPTHKGFLLADPDLTTLTANVQWMTPKQYEETNVPLSSISVINAD